MDFPDGNDDNLNRRSTDNEPTLLKLLKEVIYVLLGVLALVSGYISVHDRILLNSVEIQKIQEADERIVRKLSDIEEDINTIAEEHEQDSKDIHYRINNLTRHRHNE